MTRSMADISMCVGEYNISMDCIAYRCGLRVTARQNHWYRLDGNATIDLDVVAAHWMHHIDNHNDNRKAWIVHSWVSPSGKATWAYEPWTIVTDITKPGATYCECVFDKYVTDWRDYEKST